jgi:nitric oxide reductase subunit C
MRAADGTSILDSIQLRKPERKRRLPDDQKDRLLDLPAGHDLLGGAVPGGDMGHPPAGGDYYAPDMTRVVQRIGADGVRYAVKSPELAFANSWRKMPQLNVSDAEIEDLVAFFTWVGEINNNDWPPQDSKKRMSRGEQAMVASVGVTPGAAVFQTKGCMNCHALNGTGGTFGPALDTVGQDLTAEEIRAYVRNPKSVDPSSKMPAQTGLSDRELEEVAKFLSTLK